MEMLKGLGFWGGKGQGTVHCVLYNIDSGLRSDRMDGGVAFGELGIITGRWGRQVTTGNSHLSVSAATNGISGW